MSKEPAKPRPRPCASCPYRTNVPSGVWDESEYAKLPEYDNQMHEQPLAAFFCHQADGHVCSGWLGYKDPIDLLAVRVGISAGKLDEACINYTTDVPLFKTGAEAAEHGMREIEYPSEEANKVVEKIVRKRAVEPDFSSYCNTCGGKGGRHSYHCHNDR